ncbi:unnamed protein product [Rhizopus stolonifer]
MGNCCGTQRKQAVEEHQLKPTKKNNTSGQTLGGSNASGASSKEAMLSAAEKRKTEAENRGVSKEGGKLSRQLAEQQHKKPEYSPKKEENLVWD